MTDATYVLIVLAVVAAILLITFWLLSKWGNRP